MGKTRRWWKPTKYCQVVSPPGALVVRWQKYDTRTRRDWADLCSDILLLIFQNLGTIDLLITARLVCRNWNRVIWGEPMLWQRIDMTRHNFSMSRHALKQIAKVAIDKSSGNLQEFYASGLATDGLLLYIATRTNSLKSLGLFLCPGISVEGLMAMAERLWIKTLTTLRLIACPQVTDYYPYKLPKVIEILPMLEELEITSSDSCMWFERLGPVCTQLKCFRWNNIWYSRHRNYYHSATGHDTQAFHIGENMYELRSLELIGNKMSNEGLEAILEGCPHLEFLDIRHCFNLVLDENLVTELSSIRDLKLPDDSADEYMDSIDGNYYYDYYYYGPLPCFDRSDPCPRCWDISDPCSRCWDRSDPDYDYDQYYYDTFSTLDEIFEDAMFLY